MNPCDVVSSRASVAATSNYPNRSDIQPDLFQSYPGALDMDIAVRWMLTAAIKASSLSREQIAERMAYITGREITVPMLDTFTADSKRQHRFPLAWLTAFCAVTGDHRLLALIVEKAGFRMVTTAEAEVARKYLECQKAELELTAATELALGRTSR
jgi:hypothetical protein